MLLESQDSNPALLGKKHERYLCALHLPVLNATRIIISSTYKTRQGHQVHYYPCPPLKNLSRAISLCLDPLRRLTHTQTNCLSKVSDPKNCFVQIEQIEIFGRRDAKEKSCYSKFKWKDSRGGKSKYWFRKKTIFRRLLKFFWCRKKFQNGDFSFSCPRKNLPCLKILLGGVLGRAGG